MFAVSRAWKQLNKLKTILMITLANIVEIQRLIFILYQTPNTKHRFRQKYKYQKKQGKFYIFSASLSLIF
jgi:hypothetical protein